MDDTTIHASGDTNEDVLQALVPAMTFFSKLCERAQIEVIP